MATPHSTRAPRPPVHDLTGRRFGRWAVTGRWERVRLNGKPVLHWECRCDCGTVKLVHSDNLTGGKTTSCGCHMRETLHARAEDLAGQTFGLLTVLGRTDAPEGEAGARWMCRCECGNVTVKKAAYLKCGDTKSCGCLLPRRHGKYNTPEHRAWHNMRTRCLNPKALGWESYGGRGIAVCERWDDFLTFLADMGPKPSPQHTLDRIDVNGDYCPENCRWATPEEQGNNKRNVTLIECDGLKLSAAQWARRLGVTPEAIRARIARGDEPHEAVSRPFGTRRKMAGATCATADCAAAAFSRGLCVNCYFKQRRKGFTS